MRKSNIKKLAYIPLLAGLLISLPFIQLEARGDRGSQPLAAKDGGHHQDRGDHHDDGHHGEGYDRGYERGYDHGYNRGYDHGYYRDGVWVDSAVVPVGVGVEVGGVGVSAGVGGVYAEPQPVYYTPEPGVNIHIGN